MSSRSLTEQLAGLSHYNIKRQDKIANLCDFVLPRFLFYGIIRSNLHDRRSKDMAISYNKLWKLLNEKKMSKVDLRQKAKIAPNTMTRLNRDEQVTLTVLNKICSALDVDIGDIMEFLPDDQD